MFLLFTFCTKSGYFDLTLQSYFIPGFISEIINQRHEGQNPYINGHYDENGNFIGLDGSTVDADGNPIAIKYFPS